MFTHKPNTTEIVEYQKALEAERNALEKMVFRKSMPDKLIDNQTNVVDVMQLTLLELLKDM